LAALRRLSAISQQHNALFRRFLPGTDSPCGAFDGAVIETVMTARSKAGA
jgi:hypothetical protein